MPDLRLLNPHGTATRADLVFVFSLLLLAMNYQPEHVESMKAALIKNLNIAPQ